MKPLPGIVFIGPLCYQGKKDCDSSVCRRWFVDGEMSADCSGYHCSYCDAPCGSQGHRCDAAQTILAESERLLRESGEIA